MVTATNQGRRLVVNADDFGLSTGVNRGILHAYQCGIVTSTSLMVRGQAARQAAAWARLRPKLGVGLHVDLAEWVWNGEGWVARYEVVPTGDRAAVAAEVKRQLTAFRGLMGRMPTHLDSHQHVHRDEPVCSLLKETARDLGVPLRHFTPGVRYCGEFYGQGGKGEPYPEGIQAEALVKVLEHLPEGTTELACHPGMAEGLDSVYAEERVMEVQALCDLRVREAVMRGGIGLRSFGEIEERVGGKQMQLQG